MTFGLNQKLNDKMDLGNEMSNGLMAGKRGLIMGVANDKSIAWGIAKACADQGAEIAFSYQGDALLKRVGPLAESIGSKHVLPCDVGDEASIVALFETLKEGWGTLDFVVHAIGFSDKPRTWAKTTFGSTRSRPEQSKHLLPQVLVISATS